MTNEIKKVIQQLNEMAKIGVCDGKPVTVNSDEHGRPHFHYGLYKVYIPKEIPKNATTMKEFFDNKCKPYISNKEVSDLLSWLPKPSVHAPELSNIKSLWYLWKLYQDQD